MKRLILFTLIAYLKAFCGLSQDTNSLNQSDGFFDISFSMGPTWQSTMMNFFDLKPINGTQQFCVPFVYEKNIQGVGFSPSISILSKKSRLGIDYTLNLRYDYIYHIFGANRQINEVITNNYFSVYKILNNKNKVLTNPILGVGYGIINTRKEFVFDNTCSGNSEELFDLQFSVLELYYQIPIGKSIFVEPKVNVTTNGHPINRKSQYAFYGLRVGYIFE